MEKKILIYGASYPDTVRIIEGISKRNNTLTIAGFIDDVKYGIENEFLGYPILGDKNIIDKYCKNHCFINNVFANTIARKNIYEFLKSKSTNILSVIHENVDVSNCKIGESVFIHNGVLLGSELIIGNNVGVKIGSTISHECTLEDNVFIGPGAILCGRVHVKEGAYIGAGSTILENIIIGKNSTVGAGAVVTKNVTDNKTVVGIPAKEINL